jgi:hypothetical protein
MGFDRDQRSTHMDNHRGNTDQNSEIERLNKGLKSLRILRDDFKNPN